VIQTPRRYEISDSLSAERIIEKYDGSRTMISTPVSAPDLDSITLPIHNREALQQLELEKDHLSIVSNAVGVAAACSGIFVNSAGFLILAAAYRPLIRLEKVARLIKVMNILLEHFESQGVQIFPSLQVPDNQPLDLFVRFPQKAHLLISIRSKGDAEIVFKEENETLYVKRKGKGSRYWKPCPLVELGNYTNWLNKNRQLFGISAKEVRNTPLAKVLALWHPTKIDEHNEHLYSTISEIKLLVLRRKGTSFVIQEEDVINFIKAYLAKYEAQDA
jgi:hypothetical protein